MIVKNYIKRILFNRSVKNLSYISNFSAEDYLKFSYISRSIHIHLIIILRKVF